MIFIGMIELLVTPDSVALTEALAAVPDRRAVFLLWPREGRPYLARTNVLHRRLSRLLGAAGGASRLLQLRDAAARVEYQFTGSRLESNLLALDLARAHLQPDYRREIRLRLPPYVKLVLTNQFPRTHIATRPGNPSALYVGPFRNRSTAAHFESAFLDLFQLRRCQEDLMPHPDHPGCMYGEMGRCLRPCQAAVGVEEYRGESARVSDFLRSGGQSMLSSASAARARMSEDMDFEGAAIMHQRLIRIEEIVGLRDEMAREVEHLNAIAIVPSAQESAIELGWMRNGYWQGFTHLALEPADGRATSLDARLREASSQIAVNRYDSVLRMEHLAVISRWFYSTWCDGELLMVDDWDKIPWRKLVNAVSRVAGARVAKKAAGGAGTPQELHPAAGTGTSAKE